MFVRRKPLMFAILESPDGPALCVGFRTLAGAVAALERLRESGGVYQGHVVVETPPEETP
jgi:hypothetical protein